MKIRCATAGVLCAVAINALPGLAQDKDVQLKPENLAKQPFAFTITTKSTAQGEHFKIVIDPKSTPVRFLSGRLSVNEEGLIQSGQVKGVYSQRTIAVSGVQRVPIDGEANKSAFGFFVSSKYLTHSTFSIAVATLSPKWSVTHYWFFLKDVLPPKLSAARKSK